MRCEYYECDAFKIIKRQGQKDVIEKVERMYCNKSGEDCPNKHYLKDIELGRIKIFSQR